MQDSPLQSSNTKSLSSILGSYIADDRGQLLIVHSSRVISAVDVMSFLFQVHVYRWESTVAQRSLDPLFLNGIQVG